MQTDPCIDHLQWVWSFVAIAMLVYTNVLRWLRESVFSHRCAWTQAATLTWLAYYDFTCVYVTNMQTSLKSLLVFVHSDVKKRFLSITAIHLCTPTWWPWHRRIRKVNGNILSYKWSIQAMDRVRTERTSTCDISSPCQLLRFSYKHMIRGYMGRRFCTRRRVRLH